MTTRTRILAGTATALVVGYFLGYYFGGAAHTSQHQVLTSRELTCLSTYAATLQMLEENQPTEASHLLEDRLRASVTALRDLTTRTVQVESPEFVQGLRQAETYARRHDLKPTLGEIKEIAQHLGIQL
jgi:hypothetical protein